MQDRWLIYALGSGWGHLNRAIALALAAPCPVEILVNSAYAPTVEAKLTTPQITLHHLPSHIASVSDAQAYVQTWLTQQSFSRLIVDTFPRGLVGELAGILPQLAVPKILVHRDLDPRYVEAKGLRQFVQQHYDQILIPGENDVPLEQLPQAHRTAPWLIRDLAQLKSLRASLNAQLQLPRDQSVILVCATGKPDELKRFGEVTRQLSQHYPQAIVRCLAYQLPPGCSTDQWIEHWPGLEILQFADVVVGAAGYNTIYECAALGVPLVSLPMGRKYDRQAKRAEDHSLPVTSLDACLEAVGGLLAKPPLRLQPIEVHNGVHEAIALIKALT